MRFLDAEASTRELADHFDSLDDPGGWEIIRALFGSRHRDAAIREMKIALTDPHHPITPDFAKALSWHKIAKLKHLGLKNMGLE